MIACINLLRSASQRRLARRRRCQAALLCPAVAALALSAAGAAFLQRQIERQRTHHTVLQRALEVLDTPQRRRAALASQAAQWRQRAALAERIEAAAVPWPRVLADLSAQRPPGLRLTGVRQSGRSLRITGEAYRQDDILRYQQRLGERDWAAISSLAEMRGMPQGANDADGGSPRAKTFELRLVLASTFAPAASGEAAR